MASQQDLLANLQALTQQAQGGIPRMVAPTSRTNAPVSTARKFSSSPGLTEIYGGQQQDMAGVKTSVAQNKLNTTARVASARYPGITQQVAEYQAGHPKVSGFGKILQPLNVLSLGMRGVVSGVREVVDLLDTDKNTKASFGDWYKQTKDETYGFGTAFPMPGNFGRVVGLVGDIAFDPITWLTLGTSIPEQLVVKGLAGTAAKTGARIAAKEALELGGLELADLGVDALMRLQIAASKIDDAAKVGNTLRSQVGKRLTNTFASKQKLASLADRLGASPELVQNISKNGRRALRAGKAGTEEGIQLAEKLGLPKSGLYIAGSKYKIPFSGPIADVIETGLAGAKNGVMKFSPMEFLAEHFIGEGTNAQRGMKELRRALITGKMVVEGKEVLVDPELARYAVRLHSMDSTARGVENLMLDTYAKRVAPYLASDQDIKSAGAELYKFLDVAPENWTRQMTDVEQRAYTKVKQLFSDFHSEVEAKYKLIDDNFTMNSFDNYLPHMMTEDGQKYLASLSSARAEEIRQYLKVNMTDPSASFKSRNLVEKAVFFGTKLTKKDVAGGVERLNQIAAADPSFLGKKFFETDIATILQKYGKNYASQISTGEFMRLAMEGGVIAEAKQMGLVSKTWLSAQAKHVAALKTAVRESHTGIAEAGRNVTTAFARVMESMRGPTGKIGSEYRALKTAVKNIGTPEETLIALDGARAALTAARDESTAAWANYVNALEKGSVLVESLQKQYDNATSTLDNVLQELERVTTTYKNNISRTGSNLGQDVGTTLIEHDGVMMPIDDVIKTLNEKLGASSLALEELSASWDKSLNMDNVINDIIDGKIKLNPEFVISSIDSGISDDITEVLSKAYGSDLKKPTALKKMTMKNIRQVWDEGNATPDMKLIKAMLDPDGIVDSATLSRIGLEDKVQIKYERIGGKKVQQTYMKNGKQYTRTVTKGGKRKAIGKGEVVSRGIYSRIASGTAEANNLRELREAGIWLVVRDSMHDPEFAKKIATGLTDASTNFEKATYNRYDNLVELLRQAHALDTELYAGPSSKKGLEVVSGIETKLLENKNKYQELYAMYNDPQNFDISDDVYDAATKKLNSEKEKLIAQKTKIVEGLGKYESAAVTASTSPTGYRDLISDLSSGIQEYFLHRETVTQFRRVLETMDTINLNAPERLYNTILADVARPMRESTLEFKQQLAQVQELFEGIRTEVNKRLVRTIPEKSQNDIRARILATEQRYTEDLTQPIISKRGRQLLPTTGSELVETGNTLTDEAGKWGPGKQAIWDEDLVNLRAQGASPTEITYAEQRLLSENFTYPETERKLAGGRTRRAAKLKDKPATNIKKNVEFVEDAGVWGKKKQQLFDAELARINKGDNSIIFREELAKIFRAKPVTGKGGKIIPQTPEMEALLYKKELLGIHFPEIEAIWVKSNTGSQDRLFYNHPLAEALENDVIAALKELNIYNEAEVLPMSKRGARVATLQGGDERLPQGFTIQGKSEAAQAADIDKLRGRIRTQITKLEKAIALEQSKTSGGKATTNIGNILEQLGIKKAKITDLAKRYDAINAEIVTAKKEALAITKKVTSASSQRAAKGTLSRLIKSGKEAGYSGLINDILDTSGSVYSSRKSLKSLDDFFAELLGGDTYAFSASRGERQYRTISASDSYFGRTTNKIDGHLRGLALLMDDPNIPTNTLLQGVPGEVGSSGRYIPGAWVMRTELRGTEGMAAALEEHADSLLEKVNQVEGYPGKLKTVNKNLKAAEKATIAGESPTIVVDGETKTLRMRAREVKANEGIQAQLDSIASTPDYTRALTRETEQKVVLALSKADPTLGEYLGFNEYEWASLWDEPLRQTDVADLQKQAKRLTFERKRLLGVYNKMTDKSAGGIADKLSNIEEALHGVNIQLLEHQSRGQALNKLGVLTKQLEDGNFQKSLGIVLKDDKALEPNKALKILIGNSESSVAPSVVKSRREKLVEAWASSDELSLLDEYRSIEKELDSRLQNAWASDSKNLVKREQQLRAEVALLRKTNADNLIEIPKLQKNIIDIIDNETALTTQNIPKSAKTMAQDSAMLAEEARGVAEGLRTNPAGTIGTKRIATLNESRVLGQDAAIRADYSVTEALINNLEFDKVVEQGLQKQALDYVKTLSKQEKALLGQKIKANRELAKAMESKIRVNEATTKKLSSAYATEVSAKEGVQKAEKAFDMAVNFTPWGPQRLEEAQRAINDLAKSAKDGRYWRATVKGPKAKGDNIGWIADVDQFIEDSSYLIRQIDGVDIPDELKAVVTSYNEARTLYLTKSAELSAAQEENLFLQGLRGMEFNGRLNGALMPMALRGRVPQEAYTVTTEFDKGFVELSKYFPNIQVRKELQGIIANVHRLKEPEVVRQFSNFMGRYTKFFKAYATLSPGFHIRNAMSNTFMLFAAGGDLKYLNEGLEMSKSWLNASKRGLNVDQWIEEIGTKGATKEMQSKAREAMNAFFQSGGGLTSDFFDTGSKYFGTKTSKKMGQWVENHSRFMMSWDGVAQGLDAEGAAIRTRRFLIDYTDVSSGDKVMRQIVPFWMWTSRNLPMQISNMWVNPKAYTMYNTIKRNFRNDEEGDVVPQWMQEIGAFKLPFGKDLYATPDFGFNRVGQQLSELKDPQRLLANVNPLLRVPVELMGGRQLYSNRPFSANPVKVENGAGAILQPFLQAIGQGATGPQGDKFVNDKAYYALRNLIPFAGTAERLTPSIDTYQQRGYVNPLLGFLGVPGRQVKEQEKQSELIRRQKAIEALVSRQKALEGK